MRYYRDTYLEINLDNVIHNITHIMAKTKDMTLMAVIKADSYGHGAFMIAKTLLEAGVSHFAVATVDEGIELRRARIKCPILVLGGVRVEDLRIVSKYNLTISVHSLDWLKKAMVAYQGKIISIHLKIDTGMGRLGLTTKEELDEAIQLLHSHKHFYFEGIFSHLATSEESDETYYQMQLHRFESMLNGLDLINKYVHIANSAGSLKTPPKYVNAIRVGLMINGQKPSKDIPFDFELKQSMSLYSKLVQVKVVPKGEKLSYNGIYETQDIEEYIGTIPIGYADGYDRRLENGRVYIDGEYCKIVGRICMDYCLVKLPRLLPEGTMVELIGEHISIDEYAEKIKTNNYQATCIFSDRLPRVYKRNGQIIKTINRRLLARIGGVK
ncbi:MAG: alanine racemase [Tenericutes bacterium HGW-Tenericutes-1]|jgi:alanine racemase|nr:MAG: alanine racemase [Tenericutes bacterium HGW-Tenericutes-1]